MAFELVVGELYALFRLFVYEEGARGDTLGYLEVENMAAIGIVA
jgi:hypothetical protein